MKNKIKFLVVLMLLCQLSFTFAQTKKAQPKAIDKEPNKIIQIIDDFIQKGKK